MTDNRVEVSATGPNRVDLRPQVTAGAPVAPPPGVADDTPADQQREQKLIDDGLEDTEGSPDDARRSAPGTGDPPLGVAESLAARPG